MAMKVLQEGTSCRGAVNGSLPTVACLIGAGTSTTPAKTATANKNFLGFWTKSTATSGDSRGLYLRHYISGAGGSGEAARIYTTVNNVAGSTAHGANISLI